MSIPNAIAYRRSLAGLGQRALAKRIGLDAPRLSLTETGQRWPTQRELRALCRALKAEPSDLYPPDVLAIMEKEAR